MSGASGTSGTSGTLETKWSVSDIQRAIVQYTRNDESIPNVSFGFFKGIECDLVQVTGAGYLHEFEIKRSWSDFVADFRKKRFHDDVRVSQLTFVLPESFAGERLKKFCAERYGEFKRYFDFLFYEEGGDACRLARAMPVTVDSWRVTYLPEERFRTETYITAEMARTIRGNDAAEPYRRKLFLEELAKLYRLGVIRMWHSPPADAPESAQAPAPDEETAKPRRNCEVGTAEEQSRRFEEFCRGVNRCDGCPIRERGQQDFCEFAWGQMPYHGKESENGTDEAKHD